jgi:hypothetical protein
MNKHLFGNEKPELCKECGKCECTSKDHCEAIIHMFSIANAIMDKLISD